MQRVAAVTFGLPGSPIGTSDAVAKILVHVVLAVLSSD